MNSHHLERQEQFAAETQACRHSAQKFAGGNDQAVYATCQHCDRATVLIEHVYTPQLSLDPEEQRDQAYFTCEWCNSEIEPTGTNRRMPRKPAASENGESEMERARRVA
jgi:hypothetical protein